MGSLRSSSLPTAVAALAILLLSLAVPSALAHGLVVSRLADGSGLPLAVPTGSPAGVAAPTTPLPPLDLDALAADVAGVPATALPPGLTLSDALRPSWDDRLPVRADGGMPWLPRMLDGQMLDSPVGADGLPVRGTIEFWCPSTDSGTSVQDGANTLTVRAICPYRIIDDADLMGSPQIAINENDPNSVAFFSLHGAGTLEGPTPRSRDPNPDGVQRLTGMSHTTFTSQDQGIEWFDNPWGTDGFGEHVTGVMDRDGNLYIGALWSKRLGNDQFDYTVKVYKEQDGRYKISNYQPSKTYSNRASANVIEMANLVFVPAQKVFPLPPENGTGNATAPAGEEDIGNFTNPDEVGVHNDPNDRVMLVWHEKARDYANSSTGKSSWIDAAWTDTTARDNWTRLADAQLIGPCMAVSNPVQWNGKAYIACVADAGYRGRSRAHVGDIDIWSIDPMTGNTRLEEFTRLVGGTPVLAARDDGYMAITSTDVKSKDSVSIQLNWGWYGKHWEAFSNIGGPMHLIASNTITSGLPANLPQPPPASNSVREARITAMALTEKTDTLFLVFMERLNVLDLSDTDPSNPFISPDSAIEYKKLVATFTKCEGPTNVYDLQLGLARHPFAEAIIGEATGVFDDLQDGMVAYRDPVTDEERIYVAYGDHGVIQYGALVSDSSQPISLCSNPPPPPFVPQVAIPAALGTSSPYTTLVGSAVGLTATAMVGYLLTVKRKSANALAAKAKK